MYFAVAGLIGMSRGGDPGLGRYVLKTTPVWAESTALVRCSTSRCSRSGWSARRRHIGMESLRARARRIRNRMELLIHALGRGLRAIMPERRDTRRVRGGLQDPDARHLGGIPNQAPLVISGVLIVLFSIDNHRAPLRRGSGAVVALTTSPSASSRSSCRVPVAFAIGLSACAPSLGGLPLAVVFQRMTSG